MKDQRSSGSLLEGKIRLRKRDADSRCDTAGTQHAIGSDKAFERILYRTANDRLSRTQVTFGRRPSSQNGEHSSPFQLGLREIFSRHLFALEEPLSKL
jgi:hypothetical protein